jgi:chemotaxis protein methyltransferase CheR
MRVGMPRDARGPATKSRGTSLAFDGVTIAPDRQFAFTDADFERIRRMIRAWAGIALGPSKRNLAYSRVSRLVRAAGHDSFHDYLDALERCSDAATRQRFVNALTTNLTSFFREAHHFPLLARHLRDWPARQPMVVWCAAASTGEEAYSIAMTACEAFDTLSPPVHVVASDIDTQVLETAARGIYAIDRLENVDANRLRRFFQRGTRRNAGTARVRDEVRALVSFRRTNLLDAAWPVRGGLAAIFCRNVLIYFDRATQARIVARFAPLLGAGGLLFAGHSESLAYAHRLFRLRGQTVYDKRVEGA